MLNPIFHIPYSMRNKLLFFSLFHSITIAFLFFLPSCSKDPAIKSVQAPSAVRKVLIETFTGHNDGHGAIVSDTLLHIQQRHPDKVIGITIHSGFFAKTFGTTFTYDFHCDEGDAYYKFMGVTSNPSGAINRVGYPNKLLKDYTTEWEKLTDSMAGLPALVTLKIKNKYNATTRILKSSVQCNFLSSMKSTYKLVVLLTEDNIVAPQRDYALPVPRISYQFSHNHVLRDGLTGNLGDLLNTELIKEGDSMIKNYSYTLPINFNGKTPIENNCHIIAYIYDAVTYEVLQVEEMRMMD
ncbi:MAG: Omp28-related outer membrane protein [Bacteroidia bacterium]